MIKAFLSFNVNCEPRIIRFYDSKLIEQSHQAFRIIAQEVIKVDDQPVNILDCKALENYLAFKAIYGNNESTIVFKKYSSLYISSVIDSDEDPITILDFIDIYVGTLDTYFKDVKERDIIDNFDQCNYFLDEFISGGFLINFNGKVALSRFEEKNNVEIMNTSAKQVYYKFNEYFSNKFNKLKSNSSLNIFK